MGLFCRASARSTTLLMVALGLLMGACKVTVNDFEKWRNRRYSEEKFVEWMLDPEASDEVRAKAIEMLFEQYNYEGAEYLPRVGDLPTERRHRAMLDALPHLIDLYEGQQYSLGGDSLVTLQPVRVRDGIITLLEVAEDENVRQQLLQVVERWLEDHYRPCVTSVGRHPNSRVLSMVGAERGLPILAHYIREGTFDEMLCQASYLGDVAWLQTVADGLAAAYVDRWEQLRPESLQGQLDLVECMAAVPQSQVLKNWIFEQLTSPESTLLANFVDAFLEYVRPLATPTDIEKYTRMMQMYHGNLRWIAFEEMVQLGGAAGLNQAFDAIPEDPPPPETEEEAADWVGIPWGLWGGREIEDGLKRAAGYLCQRPTLVEIRDQARPVLEQHINDSNTVVRAVAIRCLAEVGGASSIEPLQAVTRDETVIPAWGSENNTVGELASEVLEYLQGQ